MDPHPFSDGPDAVTCLNAEGASPFVLTCEHASRHIPAAYDSLGLPESELGRHIAWDIGAASVTRHLSALIDAPAFLSGFSRLLIDLNRPLEAPSSIPIRSEDTDIPGNVGLDPQERDRRARVMFAPYHAAIARHLDTRRAADRPTRILSVHSFTPVFRGVARPWHAGVLYARDAAYGEALIAALGGGPWVAANEPYVIDRAEDYTVPIHGEDRGIPAVLIALRQDLIAQETGARAWAERLAAAIAALPADTFDANATATARTARG
ncbi:N-formylglutamate amidohydrolase [Ancylobacter sp. 6x-1]|uniref:N-formylglutamate amidohydrolase n=1 Tax=Ancylobacter crimeensis TaxID=2579147 RepID=A0ABT0DE42_9HYPH|nr:N-formylglutamate amidohydrolase [Ancylobacter crimeensis]MCK0198235.1 N-formylglutamate amidohydrolase [Ancylobacter crimeensis]